MKTIVSVIAAIITFFCIIFFVDPMIVHGIVSLFPKSAAEWIPVIKIAVWLVVLGFSLGITFLISYLVGVIFYFCLD